VLAVAMVVTAVSHSPATLAEGTLDITVTRVAREIRPENPITSLFDHSTWHGACVLYATIENDTSYHITEVAFRFFDPIINMRARSHYLREQRLGQVSILAPTLRRTDNGNIQSGEYRYAITGVNNSDFVNCSDFGIKFVDNPGKYGYVTKCQMDVITEGDCLTLVHIHFSKEFWSQARDTDFGKQWINVDDNKTMEIDRGEWWGLLSPSLAPHR
jgi:hypothetical protein